MPVTRCWTTYWKEQNWLVTPEYEPLISSGGSFSNRGVSAGDMIYIVSQRDGQLLLGGRMTVKSVVTRQEAVRILKRNDLYNAPEWVIGKKGSGTPLHHSRQLAPEVTKQLRFVSGQSDKGKALLFVNDRNLDRQTTRIVRELTMESGGLLDEIIEMTDDQPRSVDLNTISVEDLNIYRSGRELALALHEEIPNGVIYIEGSVKTVLVNRYERDPSARDMCIRHHGAACSACGLDLNAAYGEVASGFIHVHHLIPLSNLGANYVINPVDDLRPVCPNCHAIIHLRRPPYSVRDVQRFIELRRKQCS